MSTLVQNEHTESSGSNYNWIGFVDHWMCTTNWATNDGWLLDLLCVAYHWVNYWITNCWVFLHHYQYKFQVRYHGYRQDVWVEHISANNQDCISLRHYEHVDILHIVMSEIIDSNRPIVKYQIWDQAGITPIAESIIFMSQVKHYSNFHWTSSCLWIHPSKMFIHESIDASIQGDELQLAPDGGLLSYQYMYSVMGVLNPNNQYNT